MGTSQLIKEGLKVKVSQNIKGEPMEETKVSIKEEDQDLTPQDEDRRKKRRERNKVAATKCRNKKKEETTELMKDSEVVEALNQSLKQEYSKLERVERLLKELLHHHSSSSSCLRPWKRRKLDSEESHGDPGHDHEFRVPELPGVSQHSQQRSQQPHLESEPSDSAYHVYTDLINQRTSPPVGSDQPVQQTSYSLHSYSGYFDSMCLAI